jgi:hypothetical protein
MEQQMRWHKKKIRDSEDADIMSHAVDVETWYALDRFDPEFAWDPRSVRLGLSMDGFQPYSFGSSAYSCWLVKGFIFLTLVISGPKEQKKQMNIFLRPLMEELKEL